MDGIADQLLPALQALEFNQKIEPDDLAAQLPDERNGGGSGAPCGKQVVDDQHPFAHPDRVAMDGKRVRAVFEAIFDFKAVGRQLARFPNRDEARR